MQEKIIILEYIQRALERKRAEEESGIEKVPIKRDPVEVGGMKEGDRVVIFGNSSFGAKLERLFVPDGLETSEGKEHLWRFEIGAVVSFEDKSEMMLPHAWLRKM